MSVPVQPRPTRWRFPPAESADDHGVVAIGADLRPDTLLRGYRCGVFPMPEPRLDTLAWWSPDPRGVLPLDDLRISRSLRRSCRRYEVTVDQDFRGVIDRCAHLPRQGAWITDDVIDAYTELHHLGWAHSIETWNGEALVGGLYGVAIGGLFAGESMFHTSTDASKVALVALVHLLRTIGATLLDVQWATPHLASLGVIELPRTEYLERLTAATARQVTWPTSAADSDDPLANLFDKKDHGTNG